MRWGRRLLISLLPVVAISALAAMWAGVLAAAQLRRVGAAPWRRAGHECGVGGGSLTVVCRFHQRSASNPTEFVQLDAWPPRALVSRGWDFADSARAGALADSVRRALDARGVAGVSCEAEVARVLVNEAWAFGGQRVRLGAVYDTVLSAPPRWRVSVIGYPSHGAACAEQSADRRVLTPHEIGEVAREWFYDRLGL